MSLLAVGVLAGLAAGHLRINAEAAATLPPPQTAPGDASPAVRAGVIDTLRVFDAAYQHRDPATLAGLMRRCFDPAQTVLLIGTEPNEWIHGYAAIGERIASDWRNWGDVRLEVAAATVSSAGAAAWLATTGTVTFRQTTRALRFSAVLVLEPGDRWVFRQIQFQWEERPLQVINVLPPWLGARLGMR